MLFQNYAYKCYSDEYRKMSLGDWSGEGTPGNISNPEVKVASADGTWGVAPWESRSLPRDFSFNMPLFQWLFHLNSCFVVASAVRRAAIFFVAWSGDLSDERNESNVDILPL